MIFLKLFVVFAMIVALCRSDTSEKEEEKRKKDAYKKEVERLFHNFARTCDDVIEIAVKHETSDDTINALMDIRYFMDADWNKKILIFKARLTKLLPSPNLIVINKAFNDTYYKADAWDKQEKKKKEEKEKKEKEEKNSKEKNSKEKD